MSLGRLSDALKETLAVFDAGPPGTPLTTPEVAAATDVGRRAAYDRLSRLADRGRVETKAVGARGRVWWRPTSPDAAGFGGNGAASIAEQSFRSLVDAVEEYAIFLLTPDGRVASWNRGAERIKGYHRDEIVGEPLATFYTDRDVADGVPARNLDAAAADGSVEDEGWRVRKDGSEFWASVTITAIADDDGELAGYAKVTRDMTDRREFEQQLRQQRDALETEIDEMFERIDEAFFALDEDWRFTYVNQQAADLVQLPASEMLGTKIWETLPEVADGDTRDIAEAAMAHQESVDFEFFSEHLDRWIHVNAYPSESGLSVYFSDITDRKVRQRELERYETIIETVNDGIYVVDGDGRFTMVNEAYVEMTGHTREELLGSDVSLVVDADTAALARQYEAEQLDGERDSARLEADLQRADGSRFRAEATFGMLPQRDGEAERVGVVRDVSERVRRERELEQYRTIVETVDDGIYVLDPDYRFELVNEAYETFIGRSREELLGAHISKVVEDEVVEVGNRLREDLADAPSETGTVELDMAAAGGEIRTVEINYATLVSDGAYRGTTGVIRDVTERKARELELERQRERLAALATLNAAVREITDAVIDKSTQEEIERTLCDRLSATESYELAWVGGITPTGKAVKSRASSAAVGGYFDGVTVPIDPDDPREEGTFGRAVRSGEVAVATDVSSVSKRDGWSAYVEEHGVRSCAAVPIGHQGTLYGVLGVYSTRPEAFTGEERVVISQLGEIVGHAIAAVERKRALMSQEVVELEFHIADFAELLGRESSAGGRLELTEAVPIGGDVFLGYGSTDADGVALLQAIAAADPHWEDVEVLEDAGETVRYRVRLTDPPVLARVAELGGRVESLVVEDDDISLVVQLSPGTETRQVIEVVQAHYPAAEMVSRRQLSRAGDGSRQLQRAVLETLTDRQATALRTAFNSGYFEQPRLNSGQEIAESLDISASTFHQHLRAASRKVLAGVLSTDGPVEA